MSARSTSSSKCPKDSLDICSPFTTKLALNASAARSATPHQVLLRDPGDSRREFRAGAWQHLGTARAKWVRQIDDHLAVDRLARAVCRYDSVRRPQHHRSPGRLQ